MAKTISTEELIANLENPAWGFLDIRPIAAYNGWKLMGEPQGGHIPGAIPIPLSWMDRIKRSDFRTHLSSEGIDGSKSTVVYGYSDEGCAAFAEMLDWLGYENVLVYKNFLSDWAANERFPKERLKNYEKLVHPAWVNRLINDKMPETYPGSGYMILHVNSGKPEQYHKGHIPGAVYLDTNSLEKGPSWNRLPDPELENVLTAHGITKDMTVIVYGAEARLGDSEPLSGQTAGRIAAARVAVILMYAGVKDVRFLDGGIEAWIQNGLKIETRLHRPAPAGSFGTTVPAKPEILIDLKETKALLKDPDSQLVSMRTWQEFIGETSGYSYIKARGRIAGALWGQSGYDADQMENLRNADQTMRDYVKIKSLWWRSGINPDKRVVFYCGTGWRASIGFLCAHFMGWENIAVYDGGWNEWSQDEANPVQRGDPSGKL